MQPIECTLDRQTYTAFKSVWLEIPTAITFAVGTLHNRSVKVKVDFTQARTFSCLNHSVTNEQDTNQWNSERINLTLNTG